MLYQYISAFVLYVILFFFYKKLRKKSPKFIKKNFGILSVVYFVLVFLFLGTPYRLESTTFSGSHEFKKDFVVSEKVEADADPNAQDLDKNLKQLQKQSKEIQDEVNKDDN